MDFSWLADPSTYIGFLTLLVLEVVLGIDNLVFVAIVANKARPKDRDKARIIGLSLAIVIRIIMLALASYIVSLQNPIFHIFGLGISGKDILMILGGLFLIYKATTELHEKLDEQIQYSQQNYSKAIYSSIGIVIFQIIIIDAVFSLDSVITAIGMVDHIVVAMVAVTIAMIAMIMASKWLSEFVDSHPTVVMLCLGYLLMIGLVLIAEGFHFIIPKGYLYAAIGFSILIEFLNQISAKNRKENEFTSISWRKKTADSVLGMMGIRETVLANASRHGEIIEDQSIFKDYEKNMIRSVLTLAERSIEPIMTNRQDIAKLNISKSVTKQKEELKSTPFSKLVVVGKAGIEEPLGYIAKKDLLAELLTDPKFNNINKLIKQPLFIPESTTVLNALELFRNKPIDLALVVDEFGAVVGLVTIKDLMEAIMGDFPEEYEQQNEPVIKTNPDNSITVEGGLEYNVIALKLKLPPLPENTEFHTVAGLLIEELQTIPNVGDFIEYFNYRFEVSEKNGQRIERIKITPIDDAE